MIKDLARYKKRYVPSVCFLVLMSLGCLCLPSGITPTEAPSPTPPVEVTEPVGVEPPTIGGSLNDEGPWLLMETHEGLWAANPDGSGLTQITDVDYWDYELSRGVQPHGNLVAFLSPSNYDYSHMALNLISFPDGTITKITDLTTPETEAIAEQDGYFPLRGVREGNSYAWSPDGTRLAFLGFMDGSSVEVYLYDLASGNITRVSNDDEQDYWVSWSPDGDTLLYFSAEGFGSGAGFPTTGAWVAEGDGSGASFLFTPTGEPEEIVGWLDESTVVLDSWNMHCGSAELHLFDLESRQVTMLTEDCLTGTAVSSGWGAIFADTSGLYLLTPEDHTPELVSQEAVAWINPMSPEDRVFTVRFENNSTATYGSGDNDHQVSPVTPGPGSIFVAEYGLIWGWTSEHEDQPGAWITGPGIEIGQIFDGDARLPIWDGNNNLLFFAASEGGGYDLYRVTFDTHFQDLQAVVYLDALPFYVTWLGGR